MIRVLILTCLPLVAACGVDGPPVPPSQVEEEDGIPGGITITGSAEFGISG